MSSSMTEATLPPRPIAIPVNLGGIPSELIAIPHWLIWRYEWRSGKWTKVPYNAHGESRAKSTDPKTWSVFDVALRRWQAGDCDGIGFALSQDLHIAGLDIDHCRNPDTGEITPEALDVVQVMNTYTEISPSATGLRILPHGDKPAGRCKRGNYEMYQEGRFLTITGCHVEGTPRTIEPRQEALLQVHTQKIAGPAFDRQDHERPASDITLTLDDDRLLEKAFGAKNGTKLARLWSGDTSAYAVDGNEGHSEADSALCFGLAFWTQDTSQLDRLFRRSGLYRPKWDERHYGDGQTYGAVTIARAIAQVLDHYTPHQIPTEQDPWAGMRTLPAKPYPGFRPYIRGARAHGRR
jgi:putative DNA primase/helicase